MVHLLSIGVFVCVLALCVGQSGRSLYSRSGGSLYGGGRSGPYMEADLGRSYMGRSSSHIGGSGPSYPFMGSRGSSYDGYPSYIDSTDRYMGGFDRYGRGTMADRGFGSHRSRDSERSRRRFDRRGPPPRDGYIGAYGGRNGFPVHGGYCPLPACSDGGVRVGVGRGTGTGTEMAMDRRIMTGENEDISMYERFTGGHSASGGMGGGMPGTGMPGGFGLGGPGFIGGRRRGPF